MLVINDFFLMIVIFNIFCVSAVKLAITGSILSVLGFLIPMNASSEKMFHIIVQPVLNLKNLKKLPFEKINQALQAKKVRKRGNIHLLKTMILKYL